MHDLKRDKKNLVSSESLSLFTRTIAAGFSIWAHVFVGQVHSLYVEEDLDGLPS